MPDLCVTSRISKLLLLTALFSLPGCTGSTYDSHFDCPIGVGVGCASLSRVNRMIDRQEIDLGDEEGKTGAKSIERQVYIYYGPQFMSRLVSVPPRPFSS